MIGKSIKKRKGRRGTGGPKAAFAKGIRYACSKAKTIRLINVPTSDWREAAAHMCLTSELSEKCTTPYYHLVLSWHRQEHPTEEQLIAAPESMLEMLGLDEHQAVICTHHDRDHVHVHIILNRVHPVDGTVWSKSHDFMRIEQACRQIEIEQGWSHDRGRFDFKYDEKNGEVALVPQERDVWKEKKSKRAEGKRPKTSAQIEAEKRTGITGFDHSIPENLRIDVAAAIDGAEDWDDVHEGLHRLGLCYVKVGSGARVYLKGSREYAKASSFGARFSIAKMVERLGAYREPQIAAPQHQEPPQDTCWIETPAGYAEQDAHRATTFKLSLLRRMYANIFIDPEVAKAIHRVAFDGRPPVVTFRDGTTVADHGSRISASRSTPEARATMIAMAKAKGWAAMVPTGSADFVRQISLEAALAGIEVVGVPDDVKAAADRILTSVRARRSSEDLVAEQEQQTHLAKTVERDAALARNAKDRQARKEKKLALKAEAAKAVALAKDRLPHETAKDVAKTIRAQLTEDLRLHKDLREVAEPQEPADRAKAKFTADARVLDSKDSAAELDILKRTDIGLVAQSCGWTDASATHPDSSDRAGKIYRIYRRGNDTIKATLRDRIWQWKSNKTGEGGSVLDLWKYSTGQSLGHARAALRTISGLPTLPTPRAEPRDVTARGDHTEARQRWEAARSVITTDNYAVRRGISPKTLKRYPEAVRFSGLGGIYFAHRNPATGDIQGFEQRWEQNGEKNQNRFAKGGRKTVNVLGDPRTAARMVVVEGGLDALAMAELENRNDTIYVSTAGGFGKAGEEAIKHIAHGKEVVSAFDNDTPGEALHRRLAETVPDAKRLRPPEDVNGFPCKDWLDVLVAGRKLEAAVRTTRPEHPETRDEGRSPFEIPTDLPDPTLDGPGW